VYRDLRDPRTEERCVTLTEDHGNGATEGPDQPPEGHAEGPTFAELFRRIVANIGRVIQGKEETIELVVLALVSEGHVLIEDRPGVGKTTLAKALATSVDASFGRVQFTPDLLPSDVVGVTVWDRNAGAFTFRPGPIFTNLVLADEINRASPKTQSSLLEAMAERHVTIDGATRPLPAPFVVIATQNPLEHEGTYPLPDSQLDRFLMRISVGYPARADEVAILESHGDGDHLEDLSPVIDAAGVAAMARAVLTVHVAPQLRAYLVDLAEATRRHPAVWVGMSPRATLALQRVARARAAAAGRPYVTPDDVKALAEPVLAHRIMLSPDAQIQGLTAERVLGEVLNQVPVPAPARR
jgi:MoxR-like ATPase